MNNFDSTQQAKELYQKGLLLYDGVRTRRAMTEIATCFKEAAILGHAKAMYALSRCYFFGFGVEEDMSASKYWCTKAAEKGLRIARKDLLQIDLQLAHDWCFGNVKAVLNSQKCGCFQCVKIFDANKAKIHEWDRETESGTALCPFCGCDTVIPDSSGYPIDEEFLEGMNEVWFRTGSFI